MNELGLVYFLLIVALVWSIIWKGIALWKSARQGQTAWFVVLLIVNTVGLLEIIYLAFFQKKPLQRVMKPVKPSAPMPRRAVRKRR